MLQFLPTVNLSDTEHRKRIAETINNLIPLVDGAALLPQTAWTGNKTQTAAHHATIQRYLGTGGDVWTTYVASRAGEHVRLANDGSGTFTVACGGTLRWFTGAAITDGTPRTVAVGGVVDLVSFDRGADNWMIWAVTPSGLT